MVTETGFPHSRTLGTQSTFCVNVEFISQRSFGNQADLSDVVRIRCRITVAAQFIFNAAPAGIGCKVFIDRVNGVYFLLRTVGTNTESFIVAIGFQAIVVILKAPFIRKTIGYTALEIPVCIGADIAAYTSNFISINGSLGIPGAQINLPLSLFPLRLRRSKSQGCRACCHNSSQD